MQTTSNSEPTEGNVAPEPASAPQAEDLSDLRGLAEQHARSLGRFCISLLGNPDDAEDVVQETLLAAYHGRAQFRGESTIKGFLFGIARRKCAQLLTRKRRRDRLQDQLETTLESVAQQGQEGTPRDHLECQQRALRARAALSNLKPSEQELLSLRFVAELSYRELGVTLSIDEGTARKRVSRALERLRRKVAQVL